MLLVELLNVDLVACRADFFLVTNQLAVRELIWRVLDVRKRLFGSLESVEVHLEAAGVGSFLRVHLIPEVDQELLECVDRVPVGHVRDHQRGFKDARLVALGLDLFNASRNHVGYLRAHYLGHLTAVPPEDIRHTLLPSLAIIAHVKLEVLVHQQGQECLLSTLQLRVVLRALIEHDVGQLRLDFLYPCKVILGKGKCFFRIVLKFD